MSEILIYAIKSSLSLIVFFIVFLLVFKNYVNFKFIRLYLLFSIIFSVIVPEFELFEIQLSEYTEKPIIYLDNFITNSKTANIQSEDINYQNLAFYFYLLISSIFAVRLFVQLGLILRIFLKNRTSSYLGNKYVCMSDNMSPFSFLNLVFVNPKMYSESDLQKIIAHEKVHINQFHSIDILLVELIIIMFWFNPIIWKYKKYIALNQEFLADSGVIDQGYEKNNYQILILEQLFGSQSLNLVQNFNILLTKKRISMMEKSNNAKLSKRKELIVVLPIFLVLMFLGGYNGVAQNKQNNKSSEKVCTNPDVLPEYSGGKLALRKYLAINVILPKEARGKKRKANYTVNFIVDENGKVKVNKITKGINKKEDEVIAMSYTNNNSKVVNDKEINKLFKKEAKRLVNSLPNFKPGTKDGKKVKVMLQIPITFIVDDKS